MKKKKLISILHSIRESEHYASFKSGIKLGFLILGIICILSIFCTLFLPTVFDLVFGKQIIRNHVKELNISNLSADETALILLKWQKENVKDPVHYYYNNPILKFNINKLLHLFSVDGEIRPFFKTNKASWVIFSRMGRCGENSYYFIQMMDYLGFRARNVCKVAEDHCWAEYFDGNRRVGVATSDNKVISNLKDYGKNMICSKLEAEEINKSKEDVTKDYLETKELKVNIYGKEWFLSGSKITVWSTYLKNISIDSQKKVDSQKYKTNPIVFSLGIHEYYKIEWEKNLLLFTLAKEQSINLKEVDTTDFNINFGDFLRIKNLRIKLINVLVWTPIIILLELFLLSKIKYFIKKKRKSKD